jgi:NAD+ kinase
VSTVALFVHTGRDDAIDTGRQVAGWLAEHGHQVVASPTDLVLLGAQRGRDDGPDQALDLVVSIGGDGTMLRASRRAVDAGADLFGVNLGRLGYLAEVEPDGWQRSLERYFAGDFTVTDRLLVASEVWAPGEDRAAPGRSLPSGLNEVVIEKQANGRTILLAVTIDGVHFTTYVADGVIIATPTGSTAYSLSARGPIVAPDHRALLLTAVSPHSLFDRSLVLEPSSSIEVTLVGDRAAGVSVDGAHHADLDPGATVRVTADRRPARFVTFGDRNFHQILKAKFGLNEP